MEKIIFVIVLALNLQFSYAGDKGGNGGGAHVCFDGPDYRVMLGAESYDLWEGRKLHKLPIPFWDNTESKDQIIARILAKIEETQPGVVREMKRALKFMNKDGVIEDAEDVELQYVADANLLYAGKHCKYKQMVNWLDRGHYLSPESDRIFRENAFYEKSLNPLDQASLDIHEAAYKVYRAFRPIDVERNGSAEVRKFVAQSFSSQPVSINLVNPNRINYGFYTELNGNGDTKIVIIRDPKVCNEEDFTVEHRWLENLNKKTTAYSVGISNKGFVKYAVLGDVFTLNLSDGGVEDGGKAFWIYNLKDETNIFSLKLKGCGLKFPEIKKTVKGASMVGLYPHLSYNAAAFSTLRVYFSNGSSGDYR